MIEPSAWTEEGYEDDDEVPCYRPTSVPVHDSFQTGLNLETSRLSNVDATTSSGFQSAKRGRCDDTSLPDSKRMKHGEINPPVPLGECIHERL